MVNGIGRNANGFADYTEYDFFRFKSTDKIGKTGRCRYDNKKNDI
jgi:hypothetical protein